MQRNTDLINEIKAAAVALGISPSTLGEKAGQGGLFFSRLLDGKRVWPETADKVRAYIAQRLHSLALQDADAQAIAQHGKKASERIGNAVLASEGDAA